MGSSEEVVSHGVFVGYAVYIVDKNQPVRIYGYDGKNISTDYGEIPCS
jgi:hypothetical protein